MIRVVDAGTKKSRFSFHNITFSKDDPIPEHYTGEDPLIISADVGTTQIHKIYVDGGRPVLMQFGAVPSTLHALIIFQTEKGIAVKKWVIAKERSKAVTAEVSKLVEARILKAVYFPRWVSNPVMDSYPLLEIDQKVECLEGFKLKCFLDAYKGYHQIRMAKEDEEKTSFHTEQGTFCYEKMSFGLKNVGATYQRLMDNVFASQLGRNIKIYVDDLVIKSKDEGNLVSDVAETFDKLRKANIKLNPQEVHARRAKNPSIVLASIDGAKARGDTYPIPSGFYQSHKQVLLKPENSGRLAKWAIKLGEHEIIYKPRSAIKGQILADFLAESLTIDQLEVENVVTEYEALVAGLERAIQMEARQLDVYTDSLLITNQVKGLYEAREDLMKRYLYKV
ncbi:reverse transcriptase domain-containing protein [Tanacetum coccineum]